MSRVGRVHSRAGLKRRSAAASDDSSSDESSSWGPPAPPPPMKMSTAGAFEVFNGNLKMSTMEWATRDLSPSSRDWVFGNGPWTPQRRLRAKTSDPAPLGDLPQPGTPRHDWHLQQQFAVEPQSRDSTGVHGCLPNLLLDSQLESSGPCRAWSAGVGDDQGAVVEAQPQGKQRTRKAPEPGSRKVESEQRVYASAPYDRLYVAFETCHRIMDTHGLDKPAECFISPEEAAKYRAVVARRLEAAKKAHARASRNPVHE